MAHGRQALALFRSDFDDVHHERALERLLEVLTDGFGENGGRKRPERFASLDLLVDQVFHAWPSRVSEDGTIAQGPRSPLAAALIPAHNMPGIEMGRSAFEKSSALDAL